MTGSRISTRVVRLRVQILRVLWQVSLGNHVGWTVSRVLASLRKASKVMVITPGYPKVPESNNLGKYRVIMLYTKTIRQGQTQRGAKWVMATSKF